MHILAKMLYDQRTCHNPAGPVTALGDRFWPMGLDWDSRGRQKWTICPGQFDLKKRPARYFTHCSVIFWKLPQAFWLGNPLKSICCRPWESQTKRMGPKLPKWAKMGLGWLTPLSVWTGTGNHGKSRKITRGSSLKLIKSLDIKAETTFSPSVLFEFENQF